MWVAFWALLEDHSLTLARQTPSKRILDDSERRLKSLTDKLGRNALAPQVLQLLIELSDGLTKKDKAAASATATSLMSAALAYSKEGDDSGWSVGLKRLVVDVWAKAVPTE
ncbi:hypothetical protein DFJ74DRAFT_653609 [Hyaloraphidium curvatum]|nr:hypothetical protein DFJ74DRAFT_653609 [Hyaloraphidium curvatum]